jgi:hypothetical protein
MIPVRAPLVEYLRDGRCVLFVGAGLSIASGMPTWRELMDELLAKSQNYLTDATRNELDGLLAAGRYMEVAEYCRERIGRTELSTFISQRFGNSLGNVSEAHEVIARLPFAAIVTTNYDKLLELAHVKVRGRMPKTLTHRDLRGTVLFDKNLFILKAHGDLDRPEEIVLTASDYREIIHKNPAFNAVMAALLLSKAILFVGYSISDPNFRLLLEQQLTVFKDVVPPRYALMSQVGEAEAYVLKQNTGIEVLSYPKGAHDQVLTFLKELQHRTADREQPPAALKDIGVGESPVHAAHLAKAEEPWAIISSATGYERSAVLRLVVERTAGANLHADFVTPDQGVRRTFEAPLENLRHADAAVLRVVRHPRYPEGDTGFAEATKAVAAALPEDICACLRALEPNVSVVLRLDDHMASTPWEWADIDGLPLFLRNPVTRVDAGVPARARGYRLIGNTPTVLVIGDPTSDLPDARQEAQAIINLYSQQYPAAQLRTLIGPDACFENLFNQMKSHNFDMVHYAGHAWVRNGEPYLVLSGDNVIQMRELRALFAESPPAIVFLNSHFTAYAPTGLAFPDAEWSRELESMKFAEPSAETRSRALWKEILNAGVGAFVGCFGDILDEPARRVAIEFHTRLARGVAVGPALNAALGAARTAGAAAHDLSWAFYSLSGYPELSLPPGKTKMA